MHIGIEAERANNPHKTGVEHYAKQLILHLAEADNQNQYTLYLRTRPEKWLLELPQNFRVKVIPFPLFWTQLRLSWELFWHKIDLLFIPASALPIFHPNKTVVTIHDLAWKFYPESFTWFNRNFLEYSTRFAVRKAKRIIAVSESTKRDLVKFYKILPDKISVIHHGYEVLPPILGKPDTRLPEKYVLFLSTLQPRKNLEGLIKAFVQLKKERPELPHKLVVVGKTGWKFEKILEAINRNANEVVYLNYVPDAERLAILKNSDLLALPSFYEGFGMQILEAFSLGLPVITSNISSMPEVAGSAAVYFDPHNTFEIKKALADVLSDMGLRENLIQRGKERLSAFSWEKCARETLQLFQTI